MSYITIDDIRRRVDPAKLVQLTDDNKTGNVDEDMVQEFIVDAEGTVESYLRTRYTLPVPATPKVKSLCLDVVVFKLFERRPTSGDIFDARKRAYDQAISFLKDVQAGKAALDVAAAEETKTSPGTADEVLSGPSRPSPFSDEKLSGF